jgi:hypothetical protein
MKIRLKDIIDLDYFVSMDDALDSQEDIKSQTIRDRKIYRQCKNKCQTRKDLLFSWLAFRKKESTVSPGTIFSGLYTWMVYAMAFSGGISGILLAYSFLAYHGTRPINVAVFIALFVVLQVILMLLILILLIRRGIGTKDRKQRGYNSIIHTLVSSLFFNVLPVILKKTDRIIFKKSLDTLEYISSLIRMKNRDYKGLFFWPFFILTSVFAFSLSTGAFGGTLFRVIVSDMAFGWQSTLMATSARVHDMVSFIALPWSWFIPETLAHPSLEQIEGSRIILKDGISVLATQDLTSWWPFICLGILFYAVIPRGVLIITGILAQQHVLKTFDFERPKFKQLIIRMQSPVLEVDAGETPAGPVVEQHPAKEMIKPSFFKPGSGGSSGNAVILASKRVYSDAAIKRVARGIKQHWCLDVERVIDINFDYDDKDIVCQVKKSNADPVILLHEVWQPPIRGLLHYITQVRKALPQNKSLWILLTRDTGQEDLFVDGNDINFKVWKKAVFKLENPDIVVKRFL